MLLRFCRKKWLNTIFPLGKHCVIQRKPYFNGDVYTTKNNRLVACVTNKQFFNQHVTYCSTPLKELDAKTYEEVSDSTLDSLSEYFEELVEASPHLNSSDVEYGDGVLTVKFGHPHGTYVINRQTPNLQIWLSSPTSGPKRYDYIDGRWIYRHNGISLHQLLNEEICTIVKHKVNFSRCTFS